MYSNDDPCKGLQNCQQRRNVHVYIVSVPTAPSQHQGADSTQRQRHGSEERNEDLEIPSRGSPALRSNMAALAARWDRVDESQRHAFLSASASLGLKQLSSLK